MQYIREIVQLYDGVSREQLSEQHAQTQHTFGGRVIAIRDLATRFIVLSWGGFNIQLMLVRDNAFYSQGFSIGDCIEVTGTPYRSQRGELSVIPQRIAVVGRTQHNLELRRDIGSADSADTLPEVRAWRERSRMAPIENRWRLIQQLRQNMYAQNFLEVQTPVLHDVASGASARTFETHCWANDNTYHLRIAPEIYLVRLMSSGMERIFEIGQNFRNEGVSMRHQPEFTMMECYAAWEDEVWAMRECQRIITQLCMHFGVRPEVVTAGFDTMSFDTAIVQYHPSRPTMEMVRDRSWLESMLRAGGSSNTIDTTAVSDDELAYAVFESVERFIQRPTFITSHPVSISPLAMQDSAIPGRTRRFELFVGGRELANGFAQLTDVQEQERRFANQSQMQEDTMSTDRVYLQSMSYGFPSIGGFGIGIDRLAQFLFDIDDIRDVLFYPIRA